MQNKTRLTRIKNILTLIWLFFNVAFSCMAYAVIVNKIDKYTWIGIALFLLEVIVLFSFKKKYSLTSIAHKYSNSTKANFAMNLPNWLAKNNKNIYSAFLFMLICLPVYNLSTQ